MKSKDVIIGMRVKVHDITWKDSALTFGELFGENPTAERLTYYVIGFSSEDRCWVLRGLYGQGRLYVMARDFEPYTEESNEE